MDSEDIFVTNSFSLPVNASGPNNHKAPHRHVPHYAAIPNETISFLTPYSGLILTLWLIVLYAIKRYFLEMFLFPRVYKKTYLPMDDGNRRGFLVHHISAGTKIVLLIVGVKPFTQVVFGNSALHDGFIHMHSRPTMGDVLLMLTQLFFALYLFELMIRKAPSPIAVIHHVGAILIGQSAVALSLRLDHEANATMEFVLCLVWAAFDVLAELWLNVAFILYRIWPTDHNLLARIFAGTAVISSLGTVAETIMVMTLFGQAWDRWELSFKVITPILHFLFTVAQIHAAKILYLMWAKERRLALAESMNDTDIEGQAKAKAMADDQKFKGNETTIEIQSVPSTSDGPGSQPLTSSMGGKRSIWSRMPEIKLPKPFARRSP